MDILNIHLCMKKKNSENKDYFTVCPKCGSTNTYHDLSKDMMAWGATTKWLCKDCDYSAAVFPNLYKSEIEQFRKNVKQRTTEQKEIIDKANITKGFVNKKFNAILLFIYILGIITSLTLLIYDVIINQNYALFVFILLLILVVLIGIFLNKFVKDF